MTWTNVWPAVSVNGAPSGPYRSVGAVGDALRHWPLTVCPLVAIQATPLPTSWASRRCFCGWPSLSGPKAMRRMTTFLGATTLPSLRSTWGVFEPLMYRMYVFVVAS